MSIKTYPLALIPTHYFAMRNTILSLSKISEKTKNEKKRISSPQSKSLRLGQKKPGKEKNESHENQERNKRDGHLESFDPMTQSRTYAHWSARVPIKN